MELIDRLNTDEWTNSDRNNYDGLFVQYTMVRPQCEKPGQFKYAVREVREDDNVDPACNSLQLTGACGKCDPLNSVRNMELIVRDGAIFGINVDGDCVVRKNL